jgi:hypothetical protein
MLNICRLQIKNPTGVNNIMPRELKLPLDLDVNISPFIQLTPYNFKALNKQSTTPNYNKTTKSCVITLPAPESGIVNNQTHSWDVQEGLIGGRNTWDTIGKSTLAALMRKTRESLGGIIKPMAQDIFINDMASLVYNGNEFREFSFTWSFIPQSEQESTTLENMLFQIQHESLPDLVGITSTPPSFWIVEIIFPESRKLFKIKECVLTNFSCNYQPEGILTIFKSGQPVKVQLDLGFKELKKLGKADLERITEGEVC